MPVQCTEELSTKLFFSVLSQPWLYHNPRDLYLYRKVLKQKIWALFLKFYAIRIFSPPRYLLPVRLDSSSYGLEYNRQQESCQAGQ